MHSIKKKTQGQINLESYEITLSNQSIKTKQSQIILNHIDKSH